MRPISARSIGLLVLFSAAFLPSLAKAQTTCASVANSSAYEWIKNVTIGSINNTSIGNRYQNFSNLSTRLPAGSTAPISITPGLFSYPYVERVSVFIDFNRNGTFADAGELVANGETSGTGALTMNVAIPSSATSGASPMRVSLSWVNNPPACGGFPYGEVEDYTVNIEGSTPTPTPTATPTPTPTATPTPTPKPTATPTPTPKPTATPTPTPTATPTPMPTQPPISGLSQNVYISQGNQLARYVFDLASASKLELSRITIAYPNGTRPVNEGARDVVELPDGRVAVFNGKNTPYLSIYNPQTGAWTHRTIQGWGIYGNENYSDIVYSNGALFLTDSPIDSPSTAGIVKVDVESGAVTRFATSNTFSMLAAAPDGTIYALSGSSNIKKFNPVTLSQLSGVTLSNAGGIAGLAVGPDSSIYTFSMSTTTFTTTTIRRFNAKGSLLNSTQRVGPYFTDIDVSSNGFVGLSTKGGEFRIFDSQLSAELVYPLGSSGVYAGFAKPAKSQIQMASDAGDYIGQGKIYQLNKNIKAKVNYGDKNRGITINYTGSSPSIYWNLSFAGANNTALAPGLYTNAERFPFQTANHPGESISGEGRGCNTLTGTFTVNPGGIQYGLYSQVTQFSATFEQHCEGLTPALTGTVYYAVSNTGVPGDANCDGVIDGADKTLFNTMIQQGPAYYGAWNYSSCDFKLLDTNNDGQITAADSIYP